MSTVKEREAARRLIIESRGTMENGDEWVRVLAPVLGELNLLGVMQGATREELDKQRVQRLLEMRNAPRPPVVLTCAYCGEEYEAERRGQRYCTQAHKQAAYRQRRAQTR